MSKIETHQTRFHLLRLSEKEALFLRDFLQNWPYESDEPSDIAQMRLELFVVLKDVTE